MKITYDSEANATYVKLTKKKVEKTVEFGDYYIDYDSNGHIVGIEYLSTPTIEINGAEVKIR